MEIKTVSQTIEQEAPIGQAHMQTLLTAETAVPGAGREAIDVLMEEATACVETTEAQVDRVLVDGVVYCQAVYRQGESAAARAVVGQARLSEVLDLPGVTPKSMVRVQLGVESVSASYENGRIRFSIVLSITAFASALLPVTVIAEIGGIDGLQTKFRAVRSLKLAAQTRADALLTESVSLPVELDARVALMDFSSVRLGNVEPDLGGVRTKGEVQAEVLIGTGVTARPVALVKVLLPFDQLIELPEWLSRRVACDVSVARLGSAVTPGGDGEEATLKIEAELRIDAYADAEDEATALEDAFSTGAQALRVQMQNIELMTGSHRIDLAEPFRGSLLLPDGAPGIGTVLAARIKPVISRMAEENGRTVVEGALDIKAIYLPGGVETITAVRGEIPFVIRLDEILPEETRVSVEASAAEATALMSDRLEIRCQLRLSGFCRTHETVQLATEAHLSDAVQRPCGILIVWPSEGDDAWSVGKRYALDPQAIETVEPQKPVVVRMLGAQA